MGDESNVSFGKKFHSEEGSVRQCAVLMQQHVLCPQSSGQNLRKTSVVFGLTERIICDNTLDVKENDDAHALGLGGL